MNRFLAGFSKVANAASLLSKGVDVAKKVGKGAASAARGFAAGAKSSMSSTVGDALKLKGLKHITEGVGAAGGWKNALTTMKGRKSFAQGVGKAAPSLAAGTAYAAGAKKLYDKTLGSEDSSANGYAGYSAY